MEKWKNKIAVVTGASSGIGAAIVDSLLSNGLEVVGLSRNVKNTENNKFHAIRADLTREDEILTAFKQIRNEFGPIHIFVNNAGVIKNTGIIIDGDTKDWKDTFDTNVLGLCIATREAIKNMREFDFDGHIVNINSAAGHNVPNFPNLNVYPASKSAVFAITETIRNELKSMQSKIKVTSITPSTVNTQMIVRNGLTTSEAMSTLGPLLLQPTSVAIAVMFALSSEENVEISEVIMRSTASPF